jgi:3-methylcrotonyl-CoA carboxylase alpha subunit
MLSARAALQRKCYSVKRSFHDKVLVANRGEIACRVLRTCHAWNIPTVAVYSAADERALHAHMARESYRVGTGPAPVDSYLRQDDIIDVALRSGATAIHPGYGFLSENASFAQKCHDAGIAFVGPPPSAIVAMGSKRTAKTIMEAAGVPCTPGYSGDNQDPEFLLSKADDMGFPVLIKAWHGGGGKGMRLVESREEFLPSLQACQREAAAAFGDPSVLLEKYLVNPRHVEVQVVCDAHGNSVHLYERDCSLQRRHQKIIEEAPASDLDPSLRSELGELGKRSAQAVGYVNAGTVEFLLDTATNQAYYCETNTRLQVEHPISEAITGVDLVEWQLRIAAGQELPMKQEEIPCVGHAFEARIYAENPSRGFLPATGTVWHHSPPAPINAGLDAETGIRVDSGIAAGQQVGVYYDPMISKLIVHGENRSEAITKLVNALKSYQIAGVTTNIDFLIKCAQHPVFGQAGAVTTGFLEETQILRSFQEREGSEEAAALPSPLARAVGSFAATLWLEQRIGDRESTKRWASPWSSRSGSWRMGGMAGRARRTLFLEDGASSVETVSNRDGSLEVIVPLEDGSSQTMHVAGQLLRDGSLDVIVDKSRKIQATCAMVQDQDCIRVRMWPRGLADEYAWELDLRHPLLPRSSDGIHRGGGLGLVKSPMPGKISRVNFKVGDAVEHGEVVVVMEAMKMEHSIKAPFGGTILELGYKAGVVVDDGVVLFIVDDGTDDVQEQNLS